MVHPHIVYGLSTMISGAQSDSNLQRKERVADHYYWYYYGMSVCFFVEADESLVEV